MKAFTALAAAVLAGSSLVTAAAATATPRAAHPVHHHRCALPHFGPGAGYHPHINPARFGPHVTNPWFPLRPGTTFVYAGSEDGDALIDIFTPSRHTKVIDGVRTRVVNDRLLTNGVLSERTSDYYAQDVCGNVWYFGEDTAELDAHGHVLTREGSWRAGVHGAQPGVYMQRHPQLGRRFRQEWAPGNAEDQFRLVSKHAAPRVPYGAFHGALRTHESTALEPGVLDKKVYVRGIGQVVEQTVKGGTELLLLVDVLR